MNSTDWIVGWVVMMITIVVLCLIGMTNATERRSHEMLTQCMERMTLIECKEELK